VKGEGGDFRRSTLPVRDRPRRRPQSAAEVERLAGLAARSLGTTGGLEAVELAIRTAMIRLGAGLLEDLLATDTGYCGPAVECGAGHQAEFVSYRTKTIDTVLGPVRLRRAYYHCTQCGHGIVPRDAELGVTAASMSPGLRAMTARVAAAVPFAKAGGLLAELAGVHLTAKRIERSAEADGEAASAAITAKAKAICSRQVIPLPPPAPLPDMLYLAIDGTGVPMVAAATEGRPGKRPDGQAHTREVKLACCFTQTTLDEEGRPVRDPGSATYLATFEPAARFAQLVDAEARRRGAEHIRQRLKLSGMRWNVPGATSIATLRCQEASNRWEEIWQSPHNQTAPATPAICQRQHTQTTAG
jgi:hypothetical protein